MNAGIAHVLKGKLLQTGFFDKLGGLVRVQESTDIVEKEGKQVVMIRRFPVSTDAWLADMTCTEDLIVDFSPDENFKCTGYFEDQGTSVPVKTGSFLTYQSQLRFVCWFNRTGFEEDGPELASLLMSGIIDKLVGKNPYNEGPYLKIKVSLRSIPQSGKQLFAQYSFKESVTQYLMPPFESMAMDISVTFSINGNSCSSITPKPKDVC